MSAGKTSAASAGKSSVVSADETSASSLPTQGGREASACAANAARMTWDATDGLFADPSDVLSAGTRVVLSADTHFSPG